VAEQTILVCDVCGRPAVESATFRVNGRSYVKDYCSTHLSELTAGARAPRRGRRKAAVATAPAERRGRPPKAASANGRRAEGRRKT
jgi:hypothetical protein